MKASEVIEKLEELIETHGDAVVTFEYDCDYLYVKRVIEGIDEYSGEITFMLVG